MIRWKLIIAALFIAFSLTACCSQKKQATKNPAAKDSLYDRNTRDPKIQDGPPKVELKGE